MGFEWAASLDHEAVVAGKIQITGMQHSRGSKWMGQDRRFAVVNHNLGRNRIKVFEGMLVAGQKVFLRLIQGELDIHPAAEAKHHDKKGEPPPRAAHRQEACRAPIHLGTLARSKMEREESGLSRWTHRAHEILEDGVAAG